MEIVEGRKKCCLVEMRMIDADTECCSKIMVIGSRMSSFVEKGEKKKKNYISSGSSIFISTVCNVSLTSSLIRCIHFVVDRTIAHSTPPPLSCLFVFVSNSRVVWCGFRTDGKRRGKKKKKRTNEREPNVLAAPLTLETKQPISGDVVGRDADLMARLTPRYVQISPDAVGMERKLRTRELLRETIRFLPSPDGFRAGEIYLESFRVEDW